MVKVLVRGRKKDLLISRGQFALVSKNKQQTIRKINRENKFSIVSIMNVGVGTFLFKLRKK